MLFDKILSLFWELYPYLIGLYLIECLIVVFNFHFVVKINNKGFRKITPGIYFNSLWPFNKTYSFPDFPFYLTSAGIYIGSDSWVTKLPKGNMDDYIYLPYSDIKRIGLEGSKVLVNKKTVIKAQSPLVAKKILTQIESMLACKKEDRKEVLKDIFSQQYNLNLAKEKFEQSKPLLYKLESLTLFNTALILIFLPALGFFQFHMDWLSISMLCLFLISYLFSIIYYGIVDNKINGSINFINLFVFLLYPISLCHLAQYLIRYIWKDFNFLTVLGLFDKSNSYVNFYQREFALHQELLNQNYSTDLKDLFEFNQDQIKELFIELGHKESVLSEAPKKSIPHSVMYCPLCHSEYLEAATTCNECAVDLKPYLG